VFKVAPQLAENRNRGNMGIAALGAEMMSSATSALDSGQVQGAAMVKKAREVEKMQGEAAKQLIEAAAAPQAKNGRIDTYA
jgi:hypothetical protein